MAEDFDSFYLEKPAADIKSTSSQTKNASTQTEFLPLNDGDIQLILNKICTAVIRHADNETQQSMTDSGCQTSVCSSSPMKSSSSDLMEDLRKDGINHEL